MTQRLRITLFALLSLYLIVHVSSCKSDDDILLEPGTCLVDINGSFEERVLDQMPEYPGGSEAFAEALISALRYPAEAREAGIEGESVAQYEITESGLVENIRSIVDPGGGIGESTVEAFEAAMQDVIYSPAILDGNPVRVRKQYTLKYRLE